MEALVSLAVKMWLKRCQCRYSLMPNESNVALVPRITLIRLNTLTKCSPIVLIRINLICYFRVKIGDVFLLKIAG